MCRKSGNNKMTFKQLLESVAQDNSRRLMSKARAFSHLAKACRSRKPRELAYSSKHKCLKQLLKKCQTAKLISHPSKTDPELVLVFLPGCGSQCTKSKWLNAVA